MLKSIYSFIIAILLSVSIPVLAQVRGENFYIQKWVVDINAPVGLMSQNATINYNPNYTNPINSQFDNFKIKPGFSYGTDIEVGCYFGKLKVVGFGLGVLNQTATNNVTLGNFHVEYQATDANGNIYRQVVSSVGSVSEKHTVSSSNFPLVLKIKHLITKKLGFSIDGGIMLASTNIVSYSTSSAFNYEAIYAYYNGAADSRTHVYDNNPTPMSTDWLITIANYRGGNYGSVKNYFDSMRNRGYNVALGAQPTARSGAISYTASPISFILRPALNFRLKKRVYLYTGAYFSYQMFTKNVKRNYKLISNLGETYSSLYNTASDLVTEDFGLNLGLRIFLGNSKVYYEKMDYKYLD